MKYSEVIKWNRIQQVLLQQSELGVSVVFVLLRGVYNSRPLEGARVMSSQDCGRSMSHISTILPLPPLLYCVYVSVCVYKKITIYNKICIYF